MGAITFLFPSHFNHLQPAGQRSGVQVSIYKRSPSLAGFSTRVAKLADRRMIPPGERW